MATSKYIWVPWERGYKEHLDRLDISQDHISTLKKQTTELKDALLNQTSHFSEQTKRHIASTEQIISAVDRGFERLSVINERGFNEVTSALESLHSSTCYLFGMVIQKLDHQNSILEGILSALKTPRETQIKEYYVRGIEFEKQDNLALAEDCFNKSIALEMGEYCFPSHYQLGLLYLNGKTSRANLVDPKKAMGFLLKAHELIDGKEKFDQSVAPLLADCKFYVSQSCYRQLTGASNKLELELINNAIRYARESTELNSNLSCAFYELARYSSYAMHIFELDTTTRHNLSGSLTRNFEEAVAWERDYLIHALVDPVFLPNMRVISESSARLTKAKGDEANQKLAKAKGIIARLKARNISQYGHLRTEFDEVLRQVQQAEKNAQANTYFGFDDCVRALDK
jgi:tetratricopeptide (TPR) repeat protein